MAFQNPSLTITGGVAGQGGHMIPVDVRHARRGNVATIAVDNSLSFVEIKIAISCGSW